jgi:hypothetical protein
MVVRPPTNGAAIARSMLIFECQMPRLASPHPFG